MNIKQFSKGSVNDVPIIPVCCVCGKIRDINNRWHVVTIPEGVDPSHTYCPTCFQTEMADFPEILAEAEADGLL